jgi:hypothetical protein
VLFNEDEFVNAFFARGAIKATILAAPSTASKDERDKLERWYNRLLTGVKNAWATKVLNAESVKAVTVGEGISELANTALTKEKREDIAVALGVPPNILFSDAANFATAKQDDFRLYDTTIKPQSRLIESAFNEKLFAPIGLRFKFQPETLQISQEEEVQRSAAFRNLSVSNIPPWVLIQLLGYDLPVDMDLAAFKQFMEYKSGLREDPEEKKEEENPPVDPAAAQPGQRSVLESWQNHAVKALKAGKQIKGTSDDHPFETNGEISDSLAAAIGGQLEEVETVNDINLIFEGARGWERYP